MRKIGLWSNKLKECLISLLKSHNLGLLEFKVILAKKVGEQGKKIKISLLRKQGMHICCHKIKCQEFSRNAVGR